MQLFKNIDLKIICAMLLVVVTLFANYDLRNEIETENHEETIYSDVELTAAGNAQRILLFQ